MILITIILSIQTIILLFILSEMKQKKSFDRMESFYKVNTKKEKEISFFDWLNKILRGET